MIRVYLRSHVLAEASEQKELVRKRLANNMKLAPFKSLSELEECLSVMLVRMQVEWAAGGEMQAFRWCRNHCSKLFTVKLLQD